MCPDDIGDSEPDMSPMPNQSSPTPDMTKPLEKPYGDVQHNLSRPVNPANGMPKTLESLHILGADQGYGE